MRDDEPNHDRGLNGAPVPPWHSVPLYEGRDLARTELWELSLALAKSKREIARNPLLLPKARRLGVSIVTAAVVTAVPSVSLAHSRAGGGSGAAAASARDGAYLTLGDTGSRVRKLQRALGIEADGIFGRETLRAVRAAQKRHSLRVDGIVGPATWAALTRNHSSGQRSGRAGSLVKLGDRGRAVARLQRALGIEADGVFGRQTLKAVRAFQRAQGLTVDGIVGPATRAELAGHVSAGDGPTLEVGDKGPAVADLQRALGIEADGVFGHQTLSAVRAFHTRSGLSADGIVGAQTRAALAQSQGNGGAGNRNASSTGSDHSHEQAASSTASSGAAASGGSGGSGGSTVRSDVDPRLGPALALAEQMGLEVISAYRPGATIAASGNRSDHSYMPSKAIDIGGSQEALTRYARAVAGLANVQTVIFSPVGMWLSGSGWGSIHSSVTYQEHLNHVHVDTF